jgi:hypothetical protein
MAYRTIPIDPDYRRDPKTNCWCGLCQKDIKSETVKLWFAHELDRMEAIHPEDLVGALDEIRYRRAPHLHRSAVQLERVGPECAKKIKGYTIDEALYNQINEKLNS